MIVNDAPPEVIDLFAGAGGWDEGLRTAGYRGQVIGLDNDEMACAAAEKAGHARCRIDLGAHPWTAQDHLDGVIASPPCQSFSQAGKRRGIDDSRGALVHVGVQWVRGLRPRWAAFEQVPQVLPIWQAQAAELEAEGYSVWTGCLNAADFGVPQQRKRAILIARRDGVEAGPPEPTGPRPSMASALGWGMTERPYFTLAAARTTGGPDKEKVGGTGARAALYAERAAGRWVDPAVPEHDGAIRVRIPDASVLMGFRRDYPWQGTQTQQYRQLSNAVPPPLAAAIVAPLLALETAAERAA